ncbi:MAG: Integral membrane protein [Parcubacteria bacterium C7867-008]|nr:MAG: Integral membrane protein [Parcubacteria bacterium C7867-008]
MLEFLHEERNSSLSMKNIISTYLVSLKKYADFMGRATRTEYWTFTIANWAIILLLLVPYALLGEDSVFAILCGAVDGIFIFGTAIPNLAAAIRRLHDTGKSGWWFLIQFVPYIGTLVLIYFLVGRTKVEPVPTPPAASVPPVV